MSVKRALCAQCEHDFPGCQPWVQHTGKVRGRCAGPTCRSPGARVCPGAGSAVLFRIRHPRICSQDCSLAARKQPLLKFFFSNFAFLKLFQEPRVVEKFLHVLVFNIGTLNADSDKPLNVSGTCSHSNDTLSDQLPQTSHTPSQLPKK